MILSNLKGKHVVLASQSPRRQELLKGIGVDFKVLVKDGIEEDFDLHMPFNEVATFLARKKASEYSHEITENVIIITADTIVCTENDILNKPVDRADAVRMLACLS